MRKEVGRVLYYEHPCETAKQSLSAAKTHVGFVWGLEGGGADEVRMLRARNIV